ncbi:MAG: hypothetical protein RIG77_20405 [Cyclobacteriaceae bacterium]
MRKKVKAVVNYLKQAVYASLWLLIVFLFVMGSFCLIQDSDMRGCLVISLAYYFPTMWLVLLIILALFRSRKFFLTRKMALLLLILAIIYVITIDILSFTGVAEIDDFGFAGIIISIWLVSFISLRLFLNHPWHLDKTV